MKKTLLETNPYLKDAAERKELLRRSLVSSFAIEGIHLKKEHAASIKEDGPIYSVPSHTSTRSPR